MKSFQDQTDTKRCNVIFTESRPGLFKLLFLRPPPQKKIISYRENYAFTGENFVLIAIESCAFIRKSLLRYGFTYIVRKLTFKVGFHYNCHHP